MLLCKCEQNIVSNKTMRLLNYKKTEKYKDITYAERTMI